jgi:hypothetical protein
MAIFLLREPQDAITNVPSTKQYDIRSLLTGEQEERKTAPPTSSDDTGSGDNPPGRDGAEPIQLELALAPPFTRCLPRQTYRARPTDSRP